jgi:glycosyltransferase involved in cell wall biosynthesis
MKTARRDGRMTATLPRAPFTPRASSVALLCLSLDGGGAERVMIALANGLAAEGHDVDLVLLCGSGEYAREVSDAVRVIDLGAPHPALGAVAFARYLRREQPRAVLSTLIGPNAIAVAAARLLPASRRPRVVVREANTLSVALGFRSPADRLVAGTLARATYPRADRIVAVSEGARQDLIRFLRIDPRRVIAISNPSPSAAMIARSKEPLEHTWFATPRSVPIAVAAGRLVPKKGFDVLLDAIARVRRQREIRLSIMGEGPERAVLEKDIERRGLGDAVELAGFVDNPFARLARADVFVLSSIAEGMPNALIEAMACGCPVVATDCPSGPREILRDGRDGALVAPRDPAALAAAILRTLADPPDRAALRARAREFDVASAVAGYARALGLGEPSGQRGRAVPGFLP